VPADAQAQAKALREALRHLLSRQGVYSSSFDAAILETSGLPCTLGDLKLQHNALYKDLYYLVRRCWNQSLATAPALCCGSCTAFTCYHASMSKRQ
jgi:hypothetical protein